MRVAYVGFSSPIFYDYKNCMRDVPHEDWRIPNPVLECPFGLFLLYDEIWFPNRILCPKNMHQLPYVRFMDEGGIMPDLADFEMPKVWSMMQTDPTLSSRYDRFMESFSHYAETVERVGINWKPAPDNHSRSLEIAGAKVTGNSVDLGSLMLDMEVIKRLNKKNVQWITNSFTQRWLEDPDPIIVRSRLAETMVIEHIPSYQMPDGPYHPCLEDARNDPSLRDFRKWVSSYKGSASDAELKEVKREAEAAIARAQRDLFLKYLDRSSLRDGIGRTLCGFVADLLLPGISTAVSVYETIRDYFANGGRRWQAFVVRSGHLWRRDAPSGDAIRDT